MLSSPVCDLAPELQTSEIREGFMKHAVFYTLKISNMVTVQNFDTVSDKANPIPTVGMPTVHLHTAKTFVASI
jgi:hypothetical protein